MRVITRVQPERKGVATLELAILIPFLLLLIVIGVDFARIYYHELTLINAARTGAVFASAHPDNAKNKTAIEAVVLGDTQNLTPSPKVSSSTNTVDGIEYVTVTVKWDFNTVVDYPGIPKPFTLERSVKMRVTPLNPLDPFSVSDPGTGGDTTTDPTPEILP